MKNVLTLLFFVTAFTLNAQDLKSLTKSAEEATEAVDQTSFIEKFAGDQVKKLTKKLNLSEQQQTQVSTLVVSQLKSKKFQKLISSFSPSQLMGSKAQDKIETSLMDSKEFKSGLNDVLSEEQKRKMK